MSFVGMKGVQPFRWDSFPQPSSSSTLRYIKTKGSRFKDFKTKGSRFKDFSGRPLVRLFGRPLLQEDPYDCRHRYLVSGDILRTP